ncbi:hypothetical protein [Streptomyces sp. NPDC002164]|uniref:hypothetical protein n=1 Tax=Streptomyces sp. NPDC002164 TaxID=3364633 RepID=UPI003676E9D2
MLVDMARRFGAEAEKGVVDIGDVAAVRHPRQAARPRLGDALGIEDQGVPAVVQDLRGQGAQGGGGAAAGGGADQDVRRVGVQVDADRLPVGAEADEDLGGGQCFQLLADARVGEAQLLREGALLGGLPHGWGVPFLCCAR